MENINAPSFTTYVYADDVLAVDENGNLMSIRPRQNVILDSFGRTRLGTDPIQNRRWFHDNMIMRTGWSDSYVDDQANFFGVLRGEDIRLPVDRNLPVNFNRPKPSNFFDEAWAPAVTRDYFVMHCDAMGTLWCHEHSDCISIVFRDGSASVFPTHTEIEVETGDEDEIIVFNGWRTTVGIVRAMAFYDDCTFERGEYLRVPVTTGNRLVI